MRVLSKIWFISGVLLVTCLHIQAQSNDDILDQLTDEFSEELNTNNRNAILDDLLSVKTNHHFLYTGISMSNSTPYAGRDYYAGLGSTLPQLFYVNTQGWMFGLGMVKYEAPFPVKTSYVLSGGYSFYMNHKKNTRVRLAYSRGTSIDNSEAHKVSSSNSLSTSITFLQPQFISARLGYSFMASSYNSHQLSANLYKKIKLKKWSNGNSLEVTPDLNFYFSDHEYASDLYISTETSTETFYDYEYTNTFALLNAALSIPVEINIGDFDFTFEYTHNMPRRFSDYEQFSVNPTFSFSIGYLIFLK